MLTGSGSKLCSVSSDKAVSHRLFFWILVRLQKSILAYVCANFSYTENDEIVLVRVNLIESRSSEKAKMRSDGTKSKRKSWIKVVNDN